MIKKRINLCVIVCGGRDFDDLSYVFKQLTQFEYVHGEITKLVHGAARGVDQLAGEWGERQRIKVVPVKASWRKHGKGAGPIRNQRMLDEHKPDAVLAFDGGKGTADMCKRAWAEGVTVYKLGPKDVEPLR